MFDIRSIDKLPVVAVPLAHVIFDKNDNVRDPESDYQTDTLQLSLEAQGQQEPCLLYVDSRDQPAGGEPGVLFHRGLKGFRRLAALIDLMKAGGTFGPNAGKQAGQPVTHVLAKVIKKDLTAADKFYLTADHSDRLSVDRVGFARSAIAAHDAGIPEADVIWSLAELFNRFYPPKKQIILEIGNERAYRERICLYHRGTNQLLKKVSECPYVFREAYYDKLRGKAKYPKTEDIQFFCKLFSTAMTNDVTKSINRHNPGVEWTTAWNDKVAAYKAAEKPAKTAVIDGVETPVDDEGNPVVVGPPPKTMMQKAEVVAFAKGCNSRLFKMAIAFITREYDRDRSPAFDAALVSLESGMSDDLRAVLDYVAGVAPVPSASQTPPVATEQAAAA